MGRKFLEVGEIRVQCSGEGGGKTIWEEDKRGQCSGGADRGYSSKMGERGKKHTGCHDNLSGFKICKLWDTVVQINGSYLNVVFWGSY